jgi:hypothetical protein
VNNRGRCALLRIILVLIILVVASAGALAKRRVPVGGRLGVVVDERLSALRATPEFSGTLLRRMSRGGFVGITGAKTSRQGVVFYRVNVTRRTGGWIQREAVASVSRPGDDARLLNLIRASDEFDRIMRARIFLDTFRLSPLRPEVLMIYSLAAEAAAVHLSREAIRRLDEKEMNAGGAPVFSYFLNYNGLDRYNRQGISFMFDDHEKRFRYDGEGWREILYRYPASPQAVEARKRLAAK